ncbi:CapA family protein [Tenuifilum sp.]|uniref:CapA family protein n=1 Tax=Tenuifilum sp. TaxID=2760880 RepID=UPI002B5B64B2|nr:CapA family protein [Tenuifilum sp.]
MRPLLSLVLTIICSIGFAQYDSTLRLIFIGDVMGHVPQIQSAYDSSTGRYDYTDVFSELKSLLTSADYSIANLEVTLGGEPYTGYPQFSSPDELVDGLMAAGVNVLVTANNHSVDRGGDGIRRTIDALAAKNLLFTGTFLDSTDRSIRNPIVLNKNGVKLALLNYTYGTNGIPAPSPYLVNLIDTVSMANDIARAQALGVDDIVVFIHWGNEYERLPNMQQKRLTGWLHGKGVRIIIGSHPHVVQPAEFNRFENDFRLVVYSLGNFVSNQRRRYCDGGVVVLVDLMKQNGKLEVSGVGYIPVWVDTYFSSGKRKYKVFPVGMYEGKSNQFLSAASDSAFKVFVDDTRSLLNANNINFPEVKLVNGEWVVPLLSR